MKTIVSTIISIIFLYFLFSYQFSFNYEIEVNDHYYLLLTAVILSVVSNLYLIFRSWSAEPPAKGITLTFLLTFCLLFFLLFSSDDFSNEYACNLLSMLLLANVCTGMDITLGNRVIQSTILICFVIQLFIGSYQFWEAEDMKFIRHIRGTIGNSGIFACYLVCNLPFVLFLIQTPDARKYFGRFGEYIQYTISGLFFILVTLLVILTTSRAALIALLALSAISIFYFFRDRLKDPKKVLLYSLSILVLLSLGTAATIIKYGDVSKDLSTSGRALKYAVAKEHVGEYWFGGVGLGRFSYYYPKWQAGYFREHATVNSSYSMSAGESYLFFNEFAELFIEGGMIIFLLFMLLLFVFFHFKLDNAKGGELPYLKLSVTGLLICSLFTYVLHTNYLLLLFILAVTTVLQYKEKPYYYTVTRSSTYIIRGCFVILSIVVFIQLVPKAISIYKWKGSKDALLFEPELKLNYYGTLYPILYNEPNFLIDYADNLLYDSAACTKALALLSLAGKTTCSVKLFETQATAYLCSGQPEAAIIKYEFLASLIPSRFSFRFEIVQLLKRMGKREEARKMANVIIHMPVKINSPEVQSIKTEMSNFLNDANK